MARHYDVHGWDWWAATYGRRLIELLEEQGIRPPASLLDAGCGTGSLALRLASHGYRMTGVDFSPAMIDAAREKDADGKAAWRVGDLTALDLGTTFDAVVSVGDVLNHLPHLDLWEKAFTSMRRHLRAQGVAIVDAITVKGLLRLEQQSVQERDGRTLITACVWEPEERRSTLKVISFVPMEGGADRYERRVGTITEWGQPVTAILERARRAGFERVERAWSDAADPEQEERLTLVAHA